eukprot:1006819-Amphidinium_carterae.2
MNGSIVEQTLPTIATAAASSSTHHAESSALGRWGTRTAERKQRIMINEWSAWCHMFTTWFTSQYDNGESALTVINAKAACNCKLARPAQINAQLHVTRASFNLYML